MTVMNQNILLYCSSLLTTFSYTVTISYFPSLAEKKEFDQLGIGIFFGIDPLVGLPAAMILGKYMHYLGRKKVLILGCICSGAGFAMLACVHRTSKDLAFILSLIARLVSGTGTASYMTAAPAILLSKNPNDAEKVIAYFEAIGGIGFLFGPILGYLVNDSEVGCFGVCAALLWVYAVISNFYLNVEENVEFGSKNSVILQIIKKPEILIDFSVQTMMLTTLGYLSAVIEIYLHKVFKFSEDASGLLFSIYTICYFLAAMTEPLVSMLIRHEGRIICVGVFLTSFSLLLLGQTVIDHYFVALAGLGLLGVGDALMISKIYTVPTISRILKTARTRYGLEKDDKLVDAVSCLTLFFSNTGEIIGPVIGSVLAKYFGYNEGFLIMALVTIFFMIYYFVYTDSFDLLRSEMSAGLTQDPNEMMHMKNDSQINLTSKREMIKL